MEKRNALGSVRLAALNWEEAAAALPRLPAVLPVGGSAIEHGPHLPYDTDRLLAEALAAAVADRVPVLIAPIIDFVYAPVAAGRGGTLTVSSLGFIELVSDVIRSLARHGTQHVLVIDRGEGTLAALNVVSRELHGELGITIAVANPAGLAWEQRRALIRSDPDGHAGEEETALLLALAPERVRTDRIPTSTALVPAAAGLPHGPMLTPYDLAAGPGYLGNPSLATAANGQVIFDAMVAELVEHVTEWWKEHGAV